MKVICNTKALTEAFLLAAAVAPQRKVVEILQNVRLAADGDKIQLMATDAEVGIAIEISEGVEVISPGVVLLPVSKVSAILRECNDETVAIDSDDGKTQIVSSTSRFQLLTHNPDEFPTVNAVLAGQHFEVSSRSMAAMISRTVFVADEDSTRYALGGVRLEVSPGETVLHAVGTDGRRLAHATCDTAWVGPPRDSDAAFVIPARAASLAERTLRSAGGDVVRISHTANDVVLKTGTATIWARLLEGRYPAWRQVFPQGDSALTVFVVSGPLAASVRQAAIVTDSETRGVDLTFSTSALRLRASVAGIGESSVEIPVASNSDNQESISVRLDHRFLSEFLRVAGLESSLEVEVRGEGSAVLFRTSDRYQYVVMPMSTQ